MKGRESAEHGRRPGRVTVGVLGPVCAGVDGEPVELGGPAPRRLLAVLAAARGQVVPVDRLVDIVWEGAPVPSAIGSLHAYVSGLRRVLEPDRRPREPARVLVRSGPGYVLRIAALDLDAERFTAAATAGGAALARAEAATAVRTLDDALGLWRGDAYVECLDADFARPEILRLEGLRVAALEDRWAAALALGDAARAVPALAALSHAHPLRERPAGLLATALYREGRQADALEVLRQVRARLADELGIDPGPALLRLEAQLLAQDPALDPPLTAGPDGASRPTALAHGGPAPHVPAQHDPGRGAAAPPSRRLPRPRTSFVGRQPELERLRGLLDEAPLVTLTGPGGVGKTRLAVQAALARPDSDGPWLVELAGVSDATALVGTVAAALALAGVASDAELAAALARRDTLLVLDNCEHLVDAVAPLVELLLDGCPGLRVLATSREPLDLPGEVLVEVGPLEPEREGVALFRERLAAVAALDRPEADGQAVLVGLCRQLDGLPLAIELAAAQCRVLSPAQVAQLLHDRFALLRQASRTGQPQHRTLEAAVAWSYDLLDRDQQRLFSALSAFRGPFDLPLVQDLTGDLQVLDPLRSLVSKSLVSVVPGSSPRRYRLLESLRQFAAARLDPAQREALASAHHAAVTTFAEAAQRRLRTADGPTWLARLADSLPDVRAALAAGTAESDLRLATAVSWFCYRRGHVAEGVSWLRAALAAAPDASPGLRARAQTALAVVSYLTGDYTAGGQLLGPARAAALLAGDQLVASNALSFSAYLRIFDGDLEGAEATARAALDEVGILSEAPDQAEQTMLLGQVLRFSGRTAEALEVLDQAVALATGCGHTWVSGSSQWIACKVLAEGGADPEAAARLPGLLSFWSQEGDVTSWLVAAMTFAGCLARLGAPERGAVLLGAVAEMGDRVGFTPTGMVQFGGPDDVESVRTRLTPAELDAALSHGRAHAEQVLAEAADAASTAAAVPVAG